MTCPCWSLGSPFNLASFLPHRCLTCPTGLCLGRRVGFFVPPSIRSPPLLMQCESFLTLAPIFSHFQLLGRVLFSRGFAPNSCNLPVEPVFRGLSKAPKSTSESRGGIFRRQVHHPGVFLFPGSKLVKELTSQYPLIGARSPCNAWSFFPRNW